LIVCIAPVDTRRRNIKPLEISIPIQWKHGWRHKCYYSNAFLFLSIKSKIWIFTQYENYTYPRIMYVAGILISKGLIFRRRVSTGAMHTTRIKRHLNNSICVFIHVFIGYANFANYLISKCILTIKLGLCWLFWQCGIFLFFIFYLNFHEHAFVCKSNNNYFSFQLWLYII
jgi:hypothetical protein